MALSAKMRILLVDDTSAVRKSTKEMLKKMGFKNIDDYELPDQALVHIKQGIDLQQPYELIISDLDMPNMSGIELYGKLKEENLLKGCPFLLMSGSQDQMILKEAIQGGIKYIVLKPFSQQDLQGKLVDMLQK